MLASQEELVHHLIKNGMPKTHFARPSSDVVAFLEVACGFHFKLSRVLSDQGTKTHQFMIYDLENFTVDSKDSWEVATTTAAKKLKELQYGEPLIAEIIESLHGALVNDLLKMNQEDFLEKIAKDYS